MRAVLEFAGLLGCIWFLMSAVDAGSAAVAVIAPIPFLVAGLLAMRQGSLSKAARLVPAIAKVFFTVVMLGNWGFIVYSAFRKGHDLPFYALPPFLAVAFAASCISTRFMPQKNRRNDDLN
ncbi:MAG: hypothetical protein R3F58_12590 [Steroidobacteraceae bacterium]